jgi:hypothetical protein
LITHISSGSNEQWCEEVIIDPGQDGNNTAKQIREGICGEAITPPGIFYFYNRHTGMRESKLGSMYNPVYFNYNIAIHGAILVPLKPESHGCVRIPMSVARYFPALVAYGDRVYLMASKNQKNMDHQFRRLINQTRTTYQRLRQPLRQSPPSRPLLFRSYVE